MQDCHSKGYQGTWRQFIYLRKETVFPYPDELNCEKFASCGVNPLTVVAFTSIAKNNEHQAIVHSAASSNLGKMLIKHCKNVDLPIINIVRREEQVKILQELGAENVLDSSSETFENDLKQISSELKATGFFDAVGGDLTGQVLKNMPSGSTAYIYGGLSLKKFSFSPLDSIFYQKTISYFWLSLGLPN
jgi:NADPH:quinone reductase